MMVKRHALSRIKEDGRKKQAAERHADCFVEPGMASPPIDARAGVSASEGEALTFRTAAA